MKILSNITKINKILLMVIAFIFLIIIAVTAIALSSQNIHPGEGLRKEDPSPLSVKGTKSAFTEIGQIRVFTKEDELSQKTMIILIPWLEYDGSDTAFYEELARKHLSIKNIFFSFFQNHTREELFSLGEEKIKAELKLQVNEMLVLGKINAIYFNDYLFLD